MRSLARLAAVHNIGGGETNTFYRELTHLPPEE